MSKEICCPKCQSTNIRSTDNEPLAHPSITDVLVNQVPRYDNELYMKFVCDKCFNPFTKTFNLTLKD